MVNIQIEFDELLKAIDQLSAEQKHVLSARLADELTVGEKPKKPRVGNASGRVSTE